MSLSSGFNNVRTGTTLAVSALITLGAVLFMAYTYFNYSKIGAEFQERNARLNDLTLLINNVRSSVQWVYSYENDLVLERTKEEVKDGIYLYWEEINLFNRRRHLEEAANALNEIDNYLRDPEHKSITADLRASIEERFAALEEEEARNKANAEIAARAEETNDRSVLSDIDTTLHGSMENALSILYSVDVKLRRLEDLGIAYKNADKEASLAAVEQNTQQFYISLGLVVFALILNLILFRAGILRPVNVLMNTINRVREGDDTARTGLSGNNELGHLGAVLDELFDEKDRSLEEKEAERNALNASIISLIQNVFQLSQRDLSVRVPVAEDVTGAVSDSINQLAESIDVTLQDVIEVARQVNDASTQIRSQAGKVLDLTTEEQQEINQTLDQLESVIGAMTNIAALAAESRTSSEQAIITTDTAMNSVSETIDSINKIRQTIHEAEKRIKGLGERSQEIGGIVSLINNISERTHVLSLNASMHAASAGEAGRGLTVVVDEVQRLAENSREATAEIETLVNNIQLETNDTIEVMNTVISEVVHGTRLAEEAGERMESTRETTNHLVESVIRIAESAVSQTEVAKQLQERARHIGDSASVTSDEMNLQSHLTEQLVDSAARLQQSVSVFKLTERAPTVIDTPTDEDGIPVLDEAADLIDDDIVEDIDLGDIDAELASDVEDATDSDDSKPETGKEHAVG